MDSSILIILSHLLEGWGMWSSHPPSSPTPSSPIRQSPLRASRPENMQRLKTIIPNASPARPHQGPTSNYPRSPADNRDSDRDLGPARILPGSGISTGAIAEILIESLAWLSDQVLCIHLKPPSSSPHPPHFCPSNFFGTTSAPPTPPVLRSPSSGGAG